MSIPSAPPVHRGILLAYASPAFVLALPTIPVYLHLPTLYGVEMGLGLTATGALLLLARLFDTVTDPLIGYLSDRRHLRGVSERLPRRFHRPHRRRTRRCIYLRERQARAYCVLCLRQ